MTYTNALRLWHPTRQIAAEIRLPSSKSESNRALLIQALTHPASTLLNLSEANDTQLLQQLLSTESQVLNAEDAGTAMRFLAAFMAVTNQSKLLTGTPRMQQRPIGVLVDALRELGADINYLNQEGYPPLQLNGIDLSWAPQQISVPGHISSQFISALLLVAPVLPQGLRLTIIGHIASRPYINMTLALMRHFGASCFWNENTIVVEPVPYRPNTYIIPADWSSAAYWYSVVALSEKAEVWLPGLSSETEQADKAVVKLAENWGVETTFTKRGARITRKPVMLPKELSLDFSDCPDLAPTILVLAAATGITLEVTGLESLKIKETDRVSALQTELAKTGAQLLETNNSWLLTPATDKSNSEIFISTYSDHRIALAFAPLALHRKLVIGEPETVRKSYPGFWEDLGKAGFESAIGR